MRVGSLFAGIGGFDIGLERAGMEIAWQCEIDPFCNKVLAKHWPNVKRYGDIRELNGSELEPVELICGGFPCQPYSCAGKRMGAEDDRALWPEMLRIIQEVRPRWVIGENVAGFINMGLDNSISDLEREGYAVQAFVIPACAVNAPHRRDRVWIVAHRLSRPTKIRHAGTVECENGKEGDGRKTKIQNTASYRNCHAPDTEHNQAARHGQDGGRVLPITESEGLNNGNQWEQDWYSVALRTCVRGVDDGLPRQVDRVNRLKALGNAVVPKIPEIIGLAIMEIEKG